MMMFQGNAVCDRHFGEMCLAGREHMRGPSICSEKCIYMGVQLACWCGSCLSGHGVKGNIS